jgi:methyl-accepting chemotaxis protein
VNRLDQDTQKNAGIAEESTAATHSLAQELFAIANALQAFAVPTADRRVQQLRAAAR